MKNSGKNPKFNEWYSVRIFNTDNEVYVEYFDYDIASSDDLIGIFKVRLPNLKNERY